MNLPLEFKLYFTLVLATLACQAFAASVDYSSRWSDFWFSALKVLFTAWMIATAIGILLAIWL